MGLASNRQRSLAAEEELPFWGVRLIDRDCVELTDTEKLIDLNGAFTIEFWGKMGDQKEKYFFLTKAWGTWGPRRANPPVAPCGLTTVG
jgi:hypothetical protein